MISGKNIILCAGLVLLTACGDLFKVRSLDDQYGANDTRKSITRKSDLANDREQLSYALGFYFGRQIQLFKDLNLEVLLTGISQGYEGEEGVLSEEELTQIIVEQQRRSLEAASQAAIARGQAFLAENAEKEGVISLDNGIQYKVIVEGKGKKPELKSTVEVHYKGTLIDGTIFDSSYDRNQTAIFPLDGVIEGWQKTLPLMAVGSLWQVVIPSELAYGETGSGSIGPNEVLIFEIDLIDIKN